MTRTEIICNFCGQTLKSLEEEKPSDHIRMIGLPVTYIVKNDDSTYASLCNMGELHFCNEGCAGNYINEALKKLVINSEDKPA